MNKYFIILFSAILGLSLTVVSCSNNDDLSGEIDNNLISFSLSSGDSRAISIVKSVSEIYVTALFDDGTPYFENVKFVYGYNINSRRRAFHPETVIYWPEQNANLSFYISNIEGAVVNDNGTCRINYENTDSDILYGSCISNSTESYHKPVPVVLKHLFPYVTCDLSVRGANLTCAIDSVVWSYKAKGDFVLDHPVVGNQASGVWSGEEKEISRKALSKCTGKNSTTSPLSVWSSSLFYIPNSSDITISIYGRLDLSVWRGRSVGFDDGNFVFKGSLSKELSNRLMSGNQYKVDLTLTPTPVSLDLEELEGYDGQASDLNFDIDTFIYYGEWND